MVDFRSSKPHKNMTTTYRFTRTFYLQGPWGDLARFKVTEGSDIVSFSCGGDNVSLNKDAARSVYRSLSKCDWQALTTADGDDVWHGIVPDPEVIALTW
jgi:hypothetical protein